MIVHRKLVVCSHGGEICEEENFLKLPSLPRPFNWRRKRPPQHARLSRGGTGSTSYQVQQPVIERRQNGKPHQGKVFAAIQPHCDDIPIFAGGTILKLIDEGYTGYPHHDVRRFHGGNRIFVSATSSLRTSATPSRSARRLGLKDTFFLNYPNHNMDAWPIVEMRARLVFLFRR